MNSGQRRLHVPGQQLLEILDRLGVGQLGVQQREVGVRLDVIGLGGLDERVEVRTGAGSRDGV